MTFRKWDLHLKSQIQHKSFGLHLLQAIVFFALFVTWFWYRTTVLGVVILCGVALWLVLVWEATTELQ